MKRKLLFSLIVAFILLIPSALASAASTEYGPFSIDDNGVITKYNGYGGNIDLEEAKQRYHIDKEITGIGNGVFQNKTDVTSVKLTKHVKSIGNNAFSGCDHLTQINLKDTELESIGNSAFLNCIRLTQVQLPDSLQAIGSGAFQGCVSEEKITIPESVKTIQICSKDARRFWRLIYSQTTVPVSAAVLSRAVQTLRNCLFRARFPNLGRGSSKNLHSQVKG